MNCLLSFFSSPIKCRRREKKQKLSFIRKKNVKRLLTLKTHFCSLPYVNTERKNELYLYWRPCERLIVTIEIVRHCRIELWFRSTVSSLFISEKWVRTTRSSVVNPNRWPITIIIRGNSRILGHINSAIVRNNAMKRATAFGVFPVSPATWPGGWTNPVGSPVVYRAIWPFWERKCVLHFVSK